MPGVPKDMRDQLPAHLINRLAQSTENSPSIKANIWILFEAIIAVLGFLARRVHRFRSKL
jgi:hypothetical protein